MNALVTWPIYEFCFHLKKERFVWPKLRGAKKRISPSAVGTGTGDVSSANTAPIFTVYVS